MRGGVDLGKLGRRYAGVDLGGFQTLMAEHGLDEPDVRAAFEHQCRSGVPQEVAVSVGGEMTT